MTSVMTLDDVTSFLHLKYVTNTCKLFCICLFADDTSILVIVDDLVSSAERPKDFTIG